ncbi:MAG: hypothetical protein AAGF31_01950 [Planctomycetota bacterium]
MVKLFCVVIAVVTLSAAQSSGEIYSGSCCDPGFPNDLGDIASDGSGGLQTVVRPLGPGEGGGFTFYQQEDPFADPPTTPPQAQFSLFVGEPLVLTLPQLSHAPHAATVSVSQSIVGNEIEIDAQIDFLGGSTDWLPPPNEYIHLLGAFPAGDYHVNVKITRSGWPHPLEPSVARGFIGFSVLAVPEPTTSVLGILATGLAILLRPIRTHRV